MAHSLRRKVHGNADSGVPALVEAVKEHKKFRQVYMMIHITTPMARRPPKRRHHLPHMLGWATTGDIIAGVRHGGSGGWCLCDGMAPSPRQHPHALRVVALLRTSHVPLRDPFAPPSSPPPPSHAAANLHGECTLTVAQPRLVRTRHPPYEP